MWAASRLNRPSHFIRRTKGTAHTWREASKPHSNRGSKGLSLSHHPPVRARQGHGCLSRVRLVTLGGYAWLTQCVSATARTKPDWEIKQTKHIFLYKHVRIGHLRIINVQRGKVARVPTWSIENGLQSGLVNTECIFAFEVLHLTLPFTLIDGIIHSDVFIKYLQSSKTICYTTVLGTRGSANVAVPVSCCTGVKIMISRLVEAK